MFQKKGEDTELGREPCWCIASLQNGKQRQLSGTLQSLGSSVAQYVNTCICFETANT